jgi:hypothetical protein
MLVVSLFFTMLFQTPFDQEQYDENPDYSGQDHGHVRTIRLSQDPATNTIKVEDSTTTQRSRLSAPLSASGNGLNFVPVKNIAE